MAAVDVIVVDDDAEEEEEDEERMSEGAPETKVILLPPPLFLPPALPLPLLWLAEEATAVVLASFFLEEAEAEAAKVQMSMIRW